MIGKNKIQSLQKHSTMIMAMTFKSKIIYICYSIIANCHTLFIIYFTVFFLIVPTLIFQAKSNHGYPQSVHWCTGALLYVQYVVPIYQSVVPSYSQYIYIVCIPEIEWRFRGKEFFYSTLCPNVNRLYLPTATFNANISLNLFGDRG